MNIRVALFISSITIIIGGLWDFFTLRIANSASPTEQIYHLIPVVLGSFLLIISPLYQRGRPHIALAYFLLLFTLLVLIQFISFALIKPYAVLQYQLRHIVLVGVLSFLFFYLTQDLKKYRNKQP